MPLLTAELERACVLEDSLLAVCVDLSKAYDSVRLDLLEFLLEGSGLPSEVWQPMADMARAPRRLKVMTAVGDWQEPTCGFIPGCPGATAPGAVAAGSCQLQAGGLDPVLG